MKMDTAMDPLPSRDNNALETGLNGQTGFR